MKKTGTAADAAPVFGLKILERYYVMREGSKVKQRDLKGRAHTETDHWRHTSKAEQGCETDPEYGPIPGRLKAVTAGQRDKTELVPAALDAASPYFLIGGAPHPADHHAKARFQEMLFFPVQKNE